MNPLDGLKNYLGLMERRLRLYAWMRGVAAVFCAGLTLTIALAWALVLMAPSPPVLRLFRILLMVGVALATAIAIVVPLWKLSPKAVIRELERRFPVFNQRLLTLETRQNPQSSDPFLPLLAENALDITRDIQPEMLVTRRALTGMATLGATAGTALIWLILSGQGAISSGAQALWTGRSGFSIQVKASHNTIRRGSGVTLIAHLTGFSASQADLWIRYSGIGDWKPTPMVAEAESDGSAFGFQFSHLQQRAEYYVEAKGVRSPVSHLNVIDLPGVKNITITYAPRVAGGRNTGADIVAPAGTMANVEIETDRPMKAGQLVLEEGDTIDVAATKDNKTSASLTVLRDDGYHVAVLYGGEAVPVSDEHAIEVLVRDRGPGRGVEILNRPHTGPVPAGYERAVADYYRRLSELQIGHLQSGH